MKTKNINYIFEPFLNFARKESFSGILLLILTAIALIWANSPIADSYFALWHTNLTIGSGNNLFTKDLHFWINDGLMAVFFFLVGLEIKRELIAGELSSFKLASLPIFGAIGGMVFPALIFTLFNSGTDKINGWAIPTATDIAFSLGILSLLGNKVSIKLKIFLVALAIVDDMGAVIIIAIFYSKDVSTYWIALSAGIFALQMLSNILRVNKIFIYVLLGIGLWITLLNAGIHPTIAGVLTAASVPARTRIKRSDFISECRHYLDDFENASKYKTPILVNKEQQEALISIEEACEKVQAPLLSIEHKLHPYVTFLIMPIFAFSNAGVTLKGDINFTDTIVLGTVLGLVLGKPLGITLLAYFAVKTKIAAMPEGESFMKLFGVGCVAGIGFTMSLFIANLAYGVGNYLDISKIGILTGSLISGLLGYLLLKFFSKRNA